MRTKRMLVAVLAVAGLAGCDTPYGVNRYATVAVMPAPAQVLAVMRSAPGVDSAAYAPDTVSGRAVSPDSVITFDYRGGAGVRGVLQFIREGRGVLYTQHVGRMGEPPPQREVDAALPVMRAIEGRLETLPGLAGLRSAVVQECPGVKCP